MTGAAHGIGLRAALRVWAGIGVHSFGGPAGQIAVMHREIVERHRWVSDRRFMHALSTCMLVPGPEAMQLATYLGWLMHGIRAPSRPERSLSCRGSWSCSACRWRMSPSGRSPG